MDPSPIKKRQLIYALLLFSFVSFCGMFFFFKFQERQIRKNKYTEIKAIAQLKSNEIVRWLNERYSDADYFSHSPELISVIREAVIRDDRDSSIRKDLIHIFSGMKKNHQYEDILVTDRTGRILFSFNGRHVRLEPSTAFTLSAALKSSKMLMNDFYYSFNNDHVLLEILAPVDLRHEDSAMLVFTIDPATFLYPLIQSWPTPSKSSETMLVRKEGDSVVYLNHLRHASGNLLKMKTALSGENIPAVKAVSGYEGKFEGMDYRGVPVIAHISPVPGTPWFMVAEIAKREVFADLMFRIILMTFMFVFLLLFLSSLVAYLYSRRQKGIFEQLFLKEKELRLSQEEFRITLYSIGDGVITADSSGNVRRMNMVAEKLTGWKENEARGKKLEEVFQIIDEENFKIEQSPAKKVLEEGTVVSLTNHTLLISRNGQAIPIADSGAPVRDHDNKITGVVIVFHDQTNDRKIRKSLEETNKLLEETSAMAHVGGWSFDTETMLGTWTDEVARIHELDPSIETNVEIGLSFYRPDFRKKMEDAIREAIDKGKPYDLVLQLVTAKGNNRWVRTVGNPLILDGKVTRVSGIFQDITSQKVAEEEIRNLNASLEKRVEERTEQLRKSNKELESFAYTVSHDLRTPLRAIDGFSAMLSQDYKEYLDKEARRIIDVIRQNAQKMGILIDELLTFSRLGRVNMAPSLISMKELADSVFKELTQSGTTHNIELRLGDIQPIHGDPGMMKQVWLNLISNAIKFSSGQQTPIITISSREEAGNMVYLVEDNGAGFDMKYHDKLFGVFQRLHSEKEFEGTGVGLAIVQQVILRHGGKIWAEGKVNQGAVFYFSLPK